MCSQSLQLCPTLWDQTDYSPTGSSFHGILLARILEWVALPSSRGSADGTHIIICASMPRCNEVNIIIWDVLGALWKIPRIARDQKMFHLGLLWWLSGKSAWQGRRHGFWPGQILVCERELAEGQLPCREVRALQKKQFWSKQRWRWENLSTPPRKETSSHRKGGWWMSAQLPSFCRISQETPEKDIYSSPRDLRRDLHEEGEDEYLERRR